MKKGIFFLLFVFMLALIFADLFFSPSMPSNTKKTSIPFLHSLHGDTIGLSCEACHSGAYTNREAFMPSKSDCMDCHRLPLTESEGIASLDSALKNALEHPFQTKNRLPAHVVFHHGVHAKANVSCQECHSNALAWDRGEPPLLLMNECLACHQGKRGFEASATDCASCHS